jgi:outer membrane lipoprotein-sorting protein
MSTGRHLFAAGAFALFGAAVAAGQPAESGKAAIPLCPGLTIVTAISQPQGDYESIKRIESVTDEGIRVRFSSYRPDPCCEYGGDDRDPPWLPFVVHRTVRRVDLDASGSYLQVFAPEGIPETVRGTTALGISRSSFRELRDKGKTALTVYQMIHPKFGINDDGSPAFFAVDPRMAGELERVDPTPVPVSVLVNDRMTTLSALRARGKFLWDESEFFFLYDEANPISLKFRLGIAQPPDPEALKLIEQNPDLKQMLDDPLARELMMKGRDRDVLQVVKIAYTCEEPALTPNAGGRGEATAAGVGGRGAGAGLGGGAGAGASAAALEEALARTGRQRSTASTSRSEATRSARSRSPRFRRSPMCSGAIPTGSSPSKDTPTASRTTRTTSSSLGAARKPSRTRSCRGRVSPERGSTPQALANRVRRTETTRSKDARATAGSSWSSSRERARRMSESDIGAYSLLGALGLLFAAAMGFNMTKRPRTCSSRPSAFALALACVCFFRARPAAAEDDILARSLAHYASLKSYADTGTVVYEYGTNGLSRHTFRTYYRAPRHFYFEFTEDKADGGGRFAIWCEGGDFQSWWSDTGVRDTYPKGEGNRAFVLSGIFTAGSASQIPSLLFANAGLVSTLGELSDMTSAGTELVHGRSARKLTGIARSMYGTGHVHNVRQTTLWIDEETLLVRKILEDTPEGLPAGSRIRITTTFEPQANPALEDSRFEFVVPSPQK